LIAELGRAAGRNRSELIATLAVTLDRLSSPSAASDSLEIRDSEANRALQEAAR